MFLKHVIAASLLCLSLNGVCPAAGDAKVVNPEDYKHAVRVACVGDSITFGAGIKDRGVSAYPAQLGRMLGQKWDVKNFGESGATMLKKGDSPYWKRKSFKPALEFKPDVLILKLGTNDSKPQNWKHKADFVADYKEMIAEFKKVSPGVKVFVCRPVPAFPGRWGISDKVIKDEIVPMVDEVAKATGAAVIDLYKALEGQAKLFPDTVHPNAEGATLMARAVYKALTGQDAPAEVPAAK